MQSVNEVSINSIKDLVDVADKVTNPTKKGNSQTYLGGSVSNYAKSLIMTFPCMCDDSLSPSTASMISRANERNIVTMLHMLFSAINMDSAKDAVSIVQGIHNNIKTNYNIDDYVDLMADMGELPLMKPTQEAAIIADMMKQIREAKSFPLDSLEESSIGDFEVYSSANGNISIREAVKKKINSRDSKTTEKDAFGVTKSTKETEKTRHYNDPSHDWSKGDKPTPDDLDYDIKKNQAKKSENDLQDYEDQRAANKRREEREINRDKSVEIEKRLLDADVKKANEMQPALMVLSYNQLNKNGDNVGKTSFVAGVKSRIIPVESQDIIDRIFAKNKTKVNFKNFIRATTGEISFVKDFLLCINQAKIDAKNASKKGLAATMWKTLENRSIKNNFNRIRREGNDASAITVLVVSQETVNALNKYYHIDLSKVSVAKDVMNTYNLMGIIIADDSVEVAKFLYAGNDMWDQQAYSFLEKEGKDKSYKDVVNLLNKNMI